MDLREENGTWFVGSFQLPKVQCRAILNGAGQFGLSEYCDNRTNHPTAICTTCRAGAGLAFKLSQIVQRMPVSPETAAPRALSDLRRRVEEARPKNLIAFVHTFLQDA